MTKRESRKQRSNLPAMQWSPLIHLFISYYPRLGDNFSWINSCLLATPL
ncbi:hypothetical protein [Porphyromonas pogonae]|nr:hypothetical protein [Porphyromonas pogonae]